MIGVLDLLEQEVVSEVGYAMLTVEQSELCAKSKELLGELLSMWTFAFTWQNPSTKVKQLHEKALEEALHQSMAFRDFTYESLSEMDHDVYVLGHAQLQTKSFIEAWFVAREQTGRHPRIRSRRQAEGQQKKQQGPRRVVGADYADNQAEQIGTEGFILSSSETRAGMSDLDRYNSQY